MTLHDEGSAGHHHDLARRPDRQAWWDRAVEAWPDYADYQTRTDRQIPVFVLEPTD